MIMTEIVYYNSPLGILNLGAADNMLTELSFSNSNASSTKEEIALNPVLQQCIQQLDNYFSGKVFSFQLPLQQAGTPFQQKVWNALGAIEPGKTISYLQLSKNLGDAKAIRAVGTANGKNNIAIIVPCHRVIGSKGDLVGYSGQLWRKQWLLQHEAKYLNGVQDLFG
jgi:methylated-DNA-[protein]-cysteine S-methyltransferase